MPPSLAGKSEGWLVGVQGAKKGGVLISEKRGLSHLSFKLPF